MRDENPPLNVFHIVFHIVFTLCLPSRRNCRLHRTTIDNNSDENDIDEKPKILTRQTRLSPVLRNPANLKRRRGSLWRVIIFKLARFSILLRQISRLSENRVHNSISNVLSRARESVSLDQNDFCDKNLAERYAFFVLFFFSYRSNLFVKKFNNVLNAISILFRMPNGDCSIVSSFNVRHTNREGTTETRINFRDWWTLGPGEFFPRRPSPPHCSDVVFRRQ